MVVHLVAVCIYIYICIRDIQICLGSSKIAPSSIGALENRWEISDDFDLCFFWTTRVLAADRSQRPQVAAASFPPRRWVQPSP